MSQDQPPCNYDLSQIYEIIERLRQELASDAKLTPEQRGAIEALLQYYLDITKQLQRHIEAWSGTGAGPWRP
ncbi:MAG: hypothetical protein ABSB70_21500 [Candidatus Velthaea sp.]|jgi:hypothetical protein